MLKLDNALIHMLDDAHVVGGDDHGGTFVVELRQQLDDLDAVAVVEVARGLVGEEQRRIVDERAADCDALLLSAAQLIGERVSQTRLLDSRPKSCGTMPISRRSSCTSFSVRWLMLRPAMVTFPRVC